MGDSAVVGDRRWAGTYGVNIDFVAQSHCAVEVITVEDIQASSVQCINMKNCAHDNLLACVYKVVATGISVFVHLSRRTYLCLC
jgi:hypothetical protein